MPNFEDIDVVDEDLEFARKRLRRLRAYDAKAVSDATSVDTGSESIVQQHFQEEVDINTIVRRFGITRSMPSGNVAGVYGDFTGITDYESALEAIERAQAGFMTLPPDVRERFGNDPAQLIEFASEIPADRLMTELGLVPAGVETAPVAPVAPAAPVAPVAPPIAPAIG